MTNLRSSTNIYEAMSDLQLYDYIDAILKSSIMGKVESVYYSNDMLMSSEMISEAINKLDLIVYMLNLSSLPIMDYMFYFFSVSVYVLHIVICLKT